MLSRPPLFTLLLAAVTMASAIAKHASEQSSTPAHDKPKPGEKRSFEIGELQGKKIAMVFCWIPPGKAKLGAPPTQKERPLNDEHDFETEGFWLGKYPATQEQWEAVMKSNPSSFNGENGNNAKGLDTAQFPVEMVSWDDSQKFMDKLNGRGGVAAVFGRPGKFALPHEDQWEYACRGGMGNKSPYYWGDELNGTQANCNGKRPYGTTKEGTFLGRTTKVGSYETKAPHPWGLCDMAGNVSEWCENLYVKEGPERLNRVVRGGSFAGSGFDCLAASRAPISPNNRWRGRGFRVAIVPSAE